MTFIALDDEPLALVLIERLAKMVPDWNLAQTFTNARAASDYLQRNAVDLLLIDINMPDISGLDFVRNLPEEHPMIIFVTAYKEHAHEGFNLDVVDYLVKPVHPDRFKKALDKAAELLDLRRKAAGLVTPQEEDHFFVYSEYQEIKIVVKDILFIESMGDYVKIYLEGMDKPVITLKRLKHLADRLQPAGFRRIHRSYLINPIKIEARQKSQVRIARTWLSVGETYADGLKEILGE